MSINEPIGERVAKLETNDNFIMKELQELKEIIRNHTSIEEEQFEKLFSCMDDWKQKSIDTFATKQEIRTFVTIEELQNKLSLSNALAKYVVQGISLIMWGIIVAWLLHIFPNLKFF